MPNYAPTKLATTALFGMGNDASARNSMLGVDQKDYYISTEGLSMGHLYTTYKSLGMAQRMENDYRCLPRFQRLGHKRWSQ